MALINMGTADGSVLNNPPSGTYYLFLDSNNSNLLTRRDSSGTDIVYGIGEGLDSLGWVAITDTTHIVSSPLALVSGVDKALEFNIDSSISTRAPNGYGVSDYFNATTNRILSPTLGAGYMFRITFKCTPTNSSRVLTMQYSIGTGIGSKILIDTRSSELRTGGTPTFISSSTFIYSESTFLTNGMQVILNATTDSDVYDINMIMSRVN